MGTSHHFSLFPFPKKVSFSLVVSPSIVVHPRLSNYFTSTSLTSLFAPVITPSLRLSRSVSPTRFSTPSSSSSSSFSSSFSLSLPLSFSVHLSLSLSPLLPLSPSLFDHPSLYRSLLFYSFPGCHGNMLGACRSVRERERDGASGRFGSDISRAVTLFPVLRVRGSG